MYSLWGKFGQRENLPRTEYVSELDRFLHLLTSDQHTVEDAFVVNDEMMMVTFTAKDEFVVPTGRTNMFLAAFTTGLARLRLYSLLEKLGKDILYMDTDSVIFKSSNSFDPLSSMLGETLGRVTNEIPSNDHIVEFVSGGPKNYAYKCQSGKEVWKVCGLKQNFKTRQKISMSVIQSMVTAAEGSPDFLTFEDTEFVRNKRTAQIVTKDTSKTYRIKFDKGFFDPDKVENPDFIVYPFGFSPKQL